jgi:hypothetical protein
MRDLIGAKGTISLQKAAVPKKGPISDLKPLTLYHVWQELDYGINICRVTKFGYIERM